MDESVFLAGKDKKQLEKEIKKKQDAFLDVYSLYRKTGLQWIREEAIRRAYELHLMDSSFSVDI